MSKQDKKKAPQTTNSKPASNFQLSAEQQKKLHQRAMSSWIEGKRKLNENKRKHDEYWAKQNSIPIEQKLKNAMSKFKQPQVPASNKK